MLSQTKPYQTNTKSSLKQLDLDETFTEASDGCHPKPYHTQPNQTIPNQTNKSDLDETLTEASD